MMRIAGSLSRRLPLWGANLAQALIFLLPHLFVLKVMPEMGDCFRSPSSVRC